MLGHAVQRCAETQLRAALRVRGAVSPATALPGKDLVVDKSAFDELLRRGVIREGAPGTYYLYETERTGPGRRVVQLLFWLAVILLPMGIIQFCPGGP